MKKATVLVVDDDQDLLTATRILLRPKVKEVIVEHNPEKLLNILEKHSVDILLLDMNFKSAINTGNEGLYWLGKVKENFPAVQVVMITAYGAVDLAVKSLKQGAADFIVKPWQNEQLLSTLQGLMDEHKPAQANVKSKPLVSDQGIVGKSAIMNDLFYKLRSEEHTSELQSRENLVCR